MIIPPDMVTRLQPWQRTVLDRVLEAHKNGHRIHIAQRCNGRSFFRTEEGRKILAEFRAQTNKGPKR